MPLCHPPKSNCDYLSSLAPVWGVDPSPGKHSTQGQQPAWECLSCTADTKSKTTLAPLRAKVVFRGALWWAVLSRVIPPGRK